MARKNALKPEEPDLAVEANWMMLKVGTYGNEIVLPVKEGTQLIALLEFAYEANEDYGKKPSIFPMTQQIHIKTISGEHYREYRRNHLLGVNDDINT